MKVSSKNRLARDLDNILARTEPLWQDLRGQRILITGATGFFGCWLLESFAWANHRLNLNTSLVGLSRHPASLAEKAPHLVQDSAITLHAADVRHGDFPHGEFSHVIHAATEASARLNREAPLVMFDTIVEGTRRALQFSIAGSVGRFLLISSGAVYGNQPPQITHVSEAFEGGPDPLHPASAYAEGKRAAEMLCTLATSPRFTTTVARCFAFVGPYMQLDAHFAIGNFINDRLHERPIQIEGDGSSVRSYLYASDLMVWLWTILFKGQSRRAYNVGSEEALNIATLAHEVAASLPPKVGVNIASKPAPGVPVHRYVPSTTRAQQELGLRAEIPLREAIDRTHAWFADKALSTQASSQPNAIGRGAHA
jgi:nucleoside-diphosphate-sugar epimerase